MPLVKWVFIIGSLALAGLPIMNGFWSKELILEAGLSGGPIWLYILMVGVTGLTALYTTRCVWLVFFGEARSDYPVHPVGVGMKVALIPLALAAGISWLVVEPFSKLLGENTLPYHGIETTTLPALVHEVLSLPTLAVLVVIGLGILTWFRRSRLKGLINSMRSIRWASENSFGFEAVNTAFVEATNNIAEALRSTQTGILNWNVLGIIASVIVLFAIVALGG